MPQARVVLKRGDQLYATAHTDARGELRFSLPAGTYSGEIESIDGRRAAIELDGNKKESRDVQLPPASYVRAKLPTRVAAQFLPNFHSPARIVRRIPTGDRIRVKSLLKTSITPPMGHSSR